MLDSFKHPAYSVANGLTEFDVMMLAGHSDFSTTHKFYLAVRQDLVEKAKKAATAAMANDFCGALVARPCSEEKEIDNGCGKVLECNDL